MVASPCQVGCGEAHCLWCGEAHSLLVGGSSHGPHHRVWEMCAYSRGLRQPAELCAGQCSTPRCAFASFLLPPGCQRGVGYAAGRGSIQPGIGACPPLTCCMCHPTQQTPPNAPMLLIHPHQMQHPSQCTPCFIPPTARRATAARRTLLVLLLERRLRSPRRSRSLMTPVGGGCCGGGGEERGQMLGQKAQCGDSMSSKASLCDASAKRQGGPTSALRVYHLCATVARGLGPRGLGCTAHA